MSASNNLELPKKDSKDLAHQLVTTILSLLPIGAVDKVFELLVKDPAKERFEKWAKEISDALQNLIEAFDELDPEIIATSLVTNEAFKTTLITTTLEAIATHQQETIEALRNAVLNSALPNAPDDNRQKIFIQWASELTPWHIKLMRLFGKPGIQIPELSFNIPDWRMYIMLDKLAEVIETEYPEMKGNFHLVVQIIHDLHQRGLLVHEIPERQIAAKINERPVLSPIAREFLHFITSPFDESSE